MRVVSFTIVCSLVVALAAQQRPPAAELQTLRTQLASAQTEADRSEAAIDLLEADPEGSIDYVVQRLRQDPSLRVKRAIVNALAAAKSPRAVAALAEIAASQEKEVAGTARLRLAELNAVEIERRMELMRTADPSRFAALANPARAMVSTLRAGGFPEELRKPPAVFDVAMPAEIRFVVLGDFGTGKAEQKQVADAIAKRHAKLPYSFGITVGDNFYEAGLCGLDNPRWKSDWHAHYDRLSAGITGSPVASIPFFASLGNHDWDGEENGIYCSAPTEIRYTNEKTNPNWKMPATHYTYTAGPAQFFVLDTDEERSPQPPQRDWLSTALKSSTQAWKIVYGHHPIYSGGSSHGSSEWLREHNAILQSKDTQADLYLAGHDHDLQHMKEKDLHYLGIGGGGRKIRHNVACLSQSLFKHRGHGFASIRVTESILEVELVSPEGKVLHGCTITKTRMPDGTIKRTDNCKDTCTT